MALTASITEQIAAWCATSKVLADIRSKARSEYFGYDDPGEVHYMEGAGGGKSPFEISREYDIRSGG